MIKTQNWNCDGDHYEHELGQIRVLPSGGNSNMLLCFSCWKHEINWRKGRNRELGKENQFKLPAWHELEVYKPGN